MTQDLPFGAQSLMLVSDIAAERRKINDNNDKESSSGCSVFKESLTTNAYMSTTKEEAQDLVMKHRDFLKDSNIVGLSVGPKKVNGNKTDHLALIFDVVEKKDVTQLPENSKKIPEKVYLKERQNGEIRWIDTDVVETGEIVFNKAEGGSAISAEGGPGNPLLGPCTLGAIVPGMFGDDAKAKKKLQLITSAHLIDYNEDHIGKQLRYLERSRYVSLMAAGLPFIEEFFGPDQVVFPVTDFHRVNKYRNGDEDIVYNESDILWADVPEPEKVSETILGKPYGEIRKPQVGEKFTLAGITSGEHKDCTITEFPAELKVRGKDSEGEYLTFWRNMIRYDLPTRPGDSGAALLSERDRNIIGLHTFGTKYGKVGYGCQLKKYG